MGLLRHSTYIRLFCYLLIVWFTFIFFTAYKTYVNKDKRHETSFTEPQKIPTQGNSFRRELAQNQDDADYAQRQTGFKLINEQILQSDFSARPQVDALYSFPPSADFRTEPNQQYEYLRRKVQSGVEEFWRFVSSEVKKIKEKEKHLTAETSERLNNILSLGIEHKRSLMKDVNELKNADGFASWRDKEFQDLGSLIQRRISYVQNPKDCASAKKLVCDLKTMCGFGCQMHHITFCLIMAYGTGRTLVLRSKNWCYDRTGWSSIFLPLSETCVQFESSSQKTFYPFWRDINDGSETLRLPYLHSLIPKRPDFLPLAVPKDIVSRLEKLHGKPIIWWIGQFVKYMFRYQPSIEDMLDQFALKNNFSHPIVGVHVRRTDKIGTEASFHSVDEYMKLVEEYYEQLKMSQPVPIKRIYLATDDPQVFSEIKRKYNDYIIINDPDASKSAAVGSRCSKKSRDGIIKDVHFLAHSDFLVCTFSSQMHLKTTDLWMTFGILAVRRLMRKRPFFHIKREARMR